MAELKRVLIITYYWPPSGGAGVQRWLKFAKYLPEFGWQPVIYTPSNPEFPSEDPSLLKDVPVQAEIIRQPIREPYDYYRKLVGAGKGEKINTGFLTESERPKRTENLSRWVRGNLFIPDARKWWIKPSIAFLKQYLADHPVDAIVSTGPPHSMHRIALGVKRVTGLPWIADFRDPWTQIDFYQDLHLTRYANRTHHRQEREVLEGADVVTGAWPSMQTLFYQHASPKRVAVITNGYDPADVPAKTPDLDAQFTLAHVGSFSPARNPKALWQALQELKTTHPTLGQALRIKLAGKVDVSVRKDIAAYGLDSHLDVHDYIPHAEIGAFQASSRMLLLVANQAPTAKWIIPGKVFEYFSAKRPILAVCPPDGDLAAMVRDAGAGTVVGFDDVPGTKKAVLDAFLAFQSGQIPPPTHGLERYSRVALTARLSEVLTAVCGRI